MCPTPWSTSRFSDAVGRSPRGSRHAVQFFRTVPSTSRPALDAGRKLSRVIALQGKDTKMTETSTAEHTDRRATSRIDAHLPLFIYGSLLGGDPFYEETFTISINGTGGLILMASSVQPGQRIMVTNQGNDQTQECVVVSVAAQPAGSYVAFKFPTPMPQFWHGLEIGKGTLRSWIEYFTEALILQIRSDRTPETPVPDRSYRRSRENCGRPRP